MGKYLLRRILQMIPVVLGTTLLVYALVFALPGDPVKAMFGDKPVNEAVAAQIRAEYHLDQPFIVQYFIYLKNALTLNFGDTFAGQPVLDEITRAFPVTIRLGLMAFVFEAIFGVVFGIISGLKKGKWYDTVILIVSLLLISVPTFVTGFVMQYVFGIQWAILPVTAGADPGFLDLLMPAMVLGSVSMAYIIRLTRSEVARIEILFVAEVVGLLDAVDAVEVEVEDGASVGRVVLVDQREGGAGDRVGGTQTVEDRADEGRLAGAHFAPKGDHRAACQGVDDGFGCVGKVVERIDSERFHAYCLGFNTI